MFARLTATASRFLDWECWWRRLFAPAWRAVSNDRHTTYAGEYAIWDPGRGRPLKVRGEIVEWPGLGTEVYLFDPPAMLRHHPHSACLQLVQPGSKWFKLHWTRPGRTFAASKAYVEQMLWEALRGRS